MKKPQCMAAIRMGFTDGRLERLPNLVCQKREGHKGDHEQARPDIDNENFYVLKWTPIKMAKPE